MLKFVEKTDNGPVFQNPLDGAFYTNARGTHVWVFGNKSMVLHDGNPYVKYGKEIVNAVVTYSLLDDILVESRGDSQQEL